MQNIKKPIKILAEVPDAIRTVILDGLCDDEAGEEGTIHYSRVDEYVVLHDDFLGVWAGAFQYESEADAVVAMENIRTSIAKFAAEDAMVEQDGAGA